MFLRRSFIALALIALLLLAACAAPETTPSTPSTSSPSTTPSPKATPTLTPQYGGTLRIISGSGALVFGYPPNVTGTQAAWAMPCNRTLLLLDNEGRAAVPEMATAWQFSPDLKSATITLRKGVKFHDGTDFNAQVAKWNLDRIKDGKVDGTQAWTSIDVVDDFTVRINISKFQNTVLYYLMTPAGTMVSPTAVEKNGIDWARYNPVGAGPFEFVSFARDVGIKYKRFDGYWGGKPYLDGVEYIFTADATTRLILFLSGGGDTLDPTPKDVPDLVAKGYQLITQPGIATGSFLVPDSANADSPFNDKKVREAVEYAIDREGIAKGLGYGVWDAMNQMCPTGHKQAYIPDLPGRTYNPAKAKQLLAEAGYPDGFKTSIITAVQSDALVAVQNHLKAVGIDARIELTDSGKASEMELKGWHNALFSQGMGAELNWNFLLLKFFAPNSGRLTSMQRPAGLQEMIDQALATPDPDAGKELTRKAARFAYDNAMMVPLYSTRVIKILQPYVHDTGFLTSGHFASWTPAKAWLSK